METTRQLPEHRNPLLDVERAPQYEILVERRCLGQTELKVKPGQIGTSNATKKENLGVLDYAHLRAPLPKDLTGSGIFSKGSNRKYPEAYFLMRRSSDGFISATGMFKAAFPYAQVDEENAEKEYIKSLQAASSEEVAGNVWIQPDEALSLADEYGIRYWIEALLDPEPITHGTNDIAKAIQSPPPFRAREAEVEGVNGVDKTPEKKFDGRRSTRRGGSVSVRSESPTKESKIKTPARKMATPRTKRGRGRPALGSVDEGGISLESESINGDAHKHEETSSRPTSRRETVKIEVETTTTELPGDDEEVEHTKVNIEMPTGHPDLELPNDAEAMLEKARQMVREANSINGPSTTSKVSKRKAEEMIEADDEVGLEGPASRATKTRKMEVELRKERIRRRAMAGIAATLFIGAFVPTLATAFSWV